MSQAKKFGAFAGVYTPSLLTILGVIMYMRLGWIVGNAGLYTMLGIVIVAHVISFTTGLSISSIATDKRIKTGGIYYILSRSLGLPMGGSIGITLAVGTALSISLYIIGFAESFLSIQAISDFLHLVPGINAFRIVGTVVIIILVIIAFISTSLAIKTQYFILGAIGLSLISIAGGFYFHPEFHPASPLFNPATNAKPIEYLFAIFFPAVTGFTAGVAMSGDLKDPKKDIPMGTMAAIISGFLVYIVLTIAFAYFVNRDLLINNLDFISKIAWIPSLIFAGIWGATLSSALGGILGGPRILQAVAQDKILPPFLAKGVGEGSEPRNALILVFIIAEAGILIGELNVIAGVVSMFYLASYGFINMAFALESWASTDFRPSFKVPRWVGILGSIAAFLVMFKLDPVSMFLALVIMWGIFFLLKRKEIRLDFGDVWQSVWAGIIRTALFKLEKQEIEERNWRPNIILFSGGTERRKYLIELGKVIAGKQGLLSNFDLVEKQNADYLFTRAQQTIGTEDSSEGVFMRRHSVRDIYEGIELIAATYGFSGIEPNTVLLGWARQAKKPQRFTTLLKRLNQLDLNVLLVDYDKKRSFGKYKIIDIWWENKSKDNNLALKLTKFISNSQQWTNAEIRLQVVNSVNKNADLIRRNATQVFEELRMNVNLRIINNEIEQNDFFKIIRAESANADLIFIAMPNLHEGQEKDFVDKTNQLLPEIGTTILVSAASRFNELSIGLSTSGQIINLNPDDTENHVTLKLPQYPSLSHEIEKYYAKVEAINTQFSDSFIEQNQLFIRFFVETKDLLKVQFEDISSRFEKSQATIPQSYLYKKAQSNISKILTKLAIFSKDSLDEIQNNLSNLNKQWLSEYQNIQMNLPSLITIIFTKEELNKLIQETSNKSTLKFARRLKRYIRVFGHPYNYSFHFAKFIKKYNEAELYTAFMQEMYFAAKIYLKLWVEIDQLIQLFNHKILGLDTYIQKNGWDNFVQIKDDFFEKIAHFSQTINNLNYRIKTFTLHESLDSIQKSIDIINSRINIKNKFSAKDKRSINSLKTKILEVPEFWIRDNRLLIRNIKYTLLFERIKNILSKIEIDTKQQIQLQIINPKIIEKNNFLTQVNKLREQGKLSEIEKLQLEHFDNSAIEFEVQEFVNNQMENIIKRLTKEVQRFPKEDELIGTSTYNEFTELLFSPLPFIAIKSAELVNYIIEDEYIEKVNSILREFGSNLTNQLNEIGDTLRIIPFSISNLSGENKEEFSIFLAKQKLKLEKATILLNENKEELDAQFSQLKTNAQNKLSLFQFLNIAENYRQYIREQVGKKGFLRVRLFFKDWRKKILALFNKAIYQRSNAILYAKKLNTVNIRNKNKVNQLLQLGELMSINEELETKIPFYYKQLFLSKENFFNDFWIGRSQEISEAQKALKFYNQGNSGGFLIIGEYNSGKSFLAQYIAKNIFLAPEIYKIEAPTGGSVSEKVFTKKVQEITGIKASPDRIFASLAQNSVVIIENMELWWQRSDTGYTLIQKIHKWMDKYAHRLKFILCVNSHSFEFMDKILDLSTRYLYVFQTKPFSAEMLRDAILKRHKAGGMKLDFKKTSLYSGFEQAQFFSQIFNLTQGVIGDAFMLWTASISEVSKDMLQIQRPQNPNLQVLDFISDNSWALIITVILHREISLVTLEKQFSNKDDLLVDLSFLSRSGILLKIAKDVYSLNSAIYPFIKMKLFEKELI